MFKQAREGIKTGRHPRSGASVTCENKGVLKCLPSMSLKGSFFFQISHRTTLQLPSETCTTVYAVKFEQNKIPCRQELIPFTLLFKKNGNHRPTGQIMTATR